MDIHIERPSWINKKINLKDCSRIKAELHDLNLGTVCEEALCPNIGECFAKRQATFLILGKNCTRSCSFCGVRRGAVLPVDNGEPSRIAEGVRRLGLKHAVITSVTRDDLPDGGARAFADTVAALRGLGCDMVVELLIPDFSFNKDALKEVISSGPDILGHNIETVPRLYRTARSGADYKRSLDLLAYIKKCRCDMLTKSGIMLGLGEKKDEVIDTITDIADTGCDFLSMGQYLAPSKNHLPVMEYIRPETFALYKAEALKAGFRHVESGPYVRSSYYAEEYLSE